MSYVCGLGKEIPMGTCYVFISSKTNKQAACIDENLKTMSSTQYYSRSHISLLLPEFPVVNITAELWSLFDKHNMQGLLMGQMAHILSFAHSQWKTLNGQRKVVEITRTIQTCVQILILPYPGHVLGQVTLLLIKRLNIIIHKVRKIVSICWDWYNTKWDMFINHLNDWNWLVKCWWSKRIFINLLEYIIIFIHYIILPPSMLKAISNLQIFVITHR